MFLPHLLIVPSTDLTSITHLPPPSLPPPPPNLPPPLLLVPPVPLLPSPPPVSPLCQKISQAFNSIDLLNRVIVTLDALVSERPIVRN